MSKFIERVVIDLPEAYKLLCENDDFVQIEPKISEKKSTGKGKPLASYFNSLFKIPSKKDPVFLTFRGLGAHVSVGAKKVGDDNTLYPEKPRDNRKICIHANKSYTPADQDEPTDLMYKFVEKYIEKRDEIIKKGIADKTIPPSHTPKKGDPFRTPITTHYSNDNETKGGEERVDINGNPDPIISLTYNFGPYPESFKSRAGKPKFSVQDFSQSEKNKETGKMEFASFLVEGKIVDDNNVHRAIRMGTILEVFSFEFVNIKSGYGLSTQIVMNYAVINNENCESANNEQDLPIDDLFAKMMRAKEKAKEKAKGTKEEVPLDDNKEDSNEDIPKENPSYKKGMALNAFVDEI